MKWAGKGKKTWFQGKKKNQVGQALTLEITGAFEKYTKINFMVSIAAKESKWLVSKEIVENGHLALKF